MPSFSVAGKNGNEAVVFIDRDHVDEETVKQIGSIVSHPSVKNSRVMPDCHKGNGCCVGFTCELTESILPSLIGGDIGCGMTLHPFPAKIIEKKNSFETFDRVVQSIIPMGNGWDRVHKEPVISPTQYKDFFEEANLLAQAFADSYFRKFNIDLRPFIPPYSLQWMQSDLSTRLQTDWQYDMRCLGTLGGGNHFIELNEVSPSDVNSFFPSSSSSSSSSSLAQPHTYYLSVHSGSRNLGQKIASYHYTQLLLRRSGAETVPATFATNEAYGEVDDDDDADTRPFDPAMLGLSGRDAAVYFFDMIWAQIWAQMNRRAIISMILSHYDVAYDSASIIESVHNYIDFNDMVIRKGAISARKDELCVIALNMRDGLLLCRGLGNQEWNCSGPHGCGRVQSRHSAGGGGHKKTKKGSKEKQSKDIQVKMRKFQQEMGNHVYSTCVVPETLDERPSVYKDAAVIEDAIADTAVVVHHARTILNIKGYSC